MKKLLVVMMAMAVAVSFGSMAMAKDGLSVDLGFAWNFNGADMGKTIAKDGEEGAGTVVGDAILSDNTMKSAQKLYVPALGGDYEFLSGVKEGGTMQGLNTALRLRYDFLNNLFARLGFVYDYQLAGGEQEYKLPAATNLVLQFFAQEYYGVDADTPTAIANLGSKTVKQTWTYGYWSIPVTIGINVPVAEKYNIYAGIGLTYYLT